MQATEPALGAVLRPLAGIAMARHDGLDEYERLLAPARERFAASPGVQAIRSASNEVFLESFLLHFCALGSRMTEPVERWIRGAAERCAAIELPELARALNAHATAEAGHHLMMIADVKALAARWNARRWPIVDADALLHQAPSPGVLQYCAIHEQNIAGDTPYAQVAIEYEVEMLPLRYGELFVRRCVEMLGSEIWSCLSFVTEHIVLDAAHTDFNARTIGRLLEIMPSSMPALVAAASAILDAYAVFLADCAERAGRDSRYAQSSADARPLSLVLQPPLQPQDNRDGRSHPEWLDEVRSLRGYVFFDDGRRPQFRAADGHFCDDDGIDPHSHHILAYLGPVLVGCVRIYRLSGNGPAGVTEQILGEATFDRMLDELQVQRRDTLEIGRWIVHPAYRGNGRVATRLAAASAALAKRLAKDFAPRKGVVVCSVGTCDRQDALLSRIGLTAAPVDEVRSDLFSDGVRVMYCVNAYQLNGRFLNIMEQVANVVGLAEV